ncbi:hypothetical protein BB934_03285 [Microvirga ossetica]|uniref:Uncharacterized protein n=1 Tax=Microvirga ossetica TaxID=1882682 RepID=A0A1B2EBJ9_9HYPH|nr:hypothetical protein BB934_03285 [Microvirga ossetica]
MQDREQPTTQIATRAERASPLIGSNKGVLHQVPGLALIPCQRVSNAPQGPEQSNDIHALGVVHDVHDPYTELIAEVIQHG